jgi:hypothetical protein
MATIQSQILSHASGSIGGLTFIRSKSGMGMRRRSKPTISRSPAQLLARNAFKAASSVWSQGLTQAQRDAWTAFAKANPFQNALGATTFLTGQQMFVRFQGPSWNYWNGTWAGSIAPPAGTLIPAPSFVEVANTTSGGFQIYLVPSYSVSVGDLAYFSVSKPVGIGRNAATTTMRQAPPVFVGANPMPMPVIIPDPWDPTGKIRNINSYYTISVFFQAATIGNMSSPAYITANS